MMSRLLLLLLLVILSSSNHNNNNIVVSALQSPWHPSSSSSSSFHLAPSSTRHAGSRIALYAQNDDDQHQSSSIINPSFDNNCGIEIINNIERIFCLSDLHTDHADNMIYVEDKMQNSNFNFNERDLIIVAGDISHDVERFIQTLSILLLKSSKVLFVPGNHEAWITKYDDKSICKTSLEKLDYLYQICEGMEGVYTKSIIVQNNSKSQHKLWIVPLQSWYDGTLNIREEYCHDFNNWPWVDFTR